MVCKCNLMICLWWGVSPNTLCAVIITCSIMFLTFLCWLLSMSSKLWFLSFRVASSFFSCSDLQYRKPVCYTCTHSQMTLNTETNALATWRVSLLLTCKNESKLNSMWEAWHWKMSFYGSTMQLNRVVIRPTYRWKIFQVAKKTLNIKAMHYL